MARTAGHSGVGVGRGVGLALAFLLTLSMVATGRSRHTGESAPAIEAARTNSDPEMLSCSAAGEPLDSAAGSAKTTAQSTVPGTVRVIHLTPAGKAPGPGYRAAIEKAVRNIQFWISQQLNGPTFRLDPDYIQFYSTNHPASWYVTNEEGTTGDPARRFHQNVIQDAMLVAGIYYPSDTRTVVYIDADPVCVNGANAIYGYDRVKNIVVIPANDLRGLVGETQVEICGFKEDPGVCRWIGGLGHELGHAFGLPHPEFCDADDHKGPRCDWNAIMSVGYKKYPLTYFRPDEKVVLLNSPFMWAGEPTAVPTSCPAPPRRRPVRIASIPSQIAGGSSVTAWIDIDAPAPADGLVVSLSSSNPGVASVPAGVNVAAGATASQTFTLATSVVAAATLVTITATYDGSSVTATPTVTPPVYEGYLDIADCNTLIGWAWDQNRPNTPINVDIFDSSTFLTTVAANGFRQDLLNAGKGNGFHGFSWSVPSSLKNGANHSLTARYAGTATPLGATPKTINCAPSLPASPSALSATVRASSRIDLRWTDNSSDETGFDIFGKPSSGSYSRIGTVGANATSFGHSGLAPASAYSYYVRAVNAAGSSGNSNEVVATSHTNGATFVSQTAPPGVLTAGQSYPVSVTMRNSGTSTWSAAYSDKLVSQNPVGNSTWGLSGVAVSASVAPGTSVTFSFSITAPAAPGVYSFQWRMAHQLTQGFGDSTPNVPVTVQAPAGSGLAGHWRLDEGSGGTSADSSGNANHGTLLNGAAWTAGRVAGALSFDGLDDALSVVANPSLTGVTNTFTMAFWANPQATHQIDSQLTTGYSGTWGQRYAIGPHHGANYAASGHAGAGVSVGTNGVSVYEHASSYMPAVLVHSASITGWTHIVVVYENRQPRLYVNGVWVRTGATGPYANVHVTPVHIGGMSLGYFKGQLDDVRIYARVLTQAEIQGLASQ